ncbi:Segregation and condensation protein B [Fusobacterium sp. DD29]|uniref:SMC-Scp complex subunit ScpB n=1 Tax=unclassified Fusobacterium TaxID=2648384 RepID=UPI001B8BBB31|nr:MULTISPECIES: SMC-Scp complex subunit ScpB [unclassified Fusobacterium]MBR8701719.1 Segregation and condensation protein B [Fusobacterium sp. DD45]MBR8711495.1 Segregation and condensation protein B [Fusobacterium sp. DD28]MBR8749825.1 Segregation and condensation protein B [Fusobacterium sp. DD29]MBR8752044.1 Segregation and condensation protein B [Fusobacterium sp. DD26]MBR8762067.1 Segregation and condensation protein B [Fusobacterium sp. DD25]
MEIKQKIEAILLLGGDELQIKELSKFFGVPIDEMLKILEELKEDRRDTGINIEIDGEFVTLVTNPIYGEVINDFFEQESKPKKLSGAALETLSIVAYRQPVTKSEIEAIRGVNVDRIVQNMEEKKFIRVCGKKETTGRPNLYEITDKFLGYIGIKSIEELPNYQEIKGSCDNGGNENQ